MVFHYCLYGQDIVTNKVLNRIKQKKNNSSTSVNIGLLKVDLSNKIDMEIPCSLNWQRKYPENNKNKLSIKVWQNSAWVCVEYPRDLDTVLRFYIRKDGSEIISQKPNTIPDRDVESFLLGPIMGCALRLKNYTCLHASVLSYKDNAFALIGHSGAGKSTTASALLSQGAKLIADDVAVLNKMNDQQVDALPGYPGVRLMPESFASNDRDVNDYETVVSISEKRFIPLPNDDWQFEEKTLPLKCIYELKTRCSSLKGIKIDNLTPAESLIALLPHSYTRYMLNEIQRPKEFSFMASLSRLVDVKSLQCPNEISLLPNIAKSILDDFNQTLEKNTH